MQTTLNENYLKNLPDTEKAKIAKILLNGGRKGSSSGEILQLPVLRLLKNSTANHIAVEFLRVSSDDQREGFSISAQEEKSKEYMAEHGLHCIKGWSVTESASKELDRKEFFDMLKYVSENGIKNVVFDKIDRACRGLRGAVLIEDLVEAGVHFHFTRDNLIVDKDSPPGDKLRFYLGVVLAKYYIDNLKTEIHKGLSQRWKDGYWNGLAPIGYRNSRDHIGRAWVEVDQKISPYIQQVFELYATGNYSYKSLEKFLSGKATIEKKIQMEENGETVYKIENYPITHKCIEHLICNPFYYGARRKKGKAIFTGKEKHTPLISKELFDACQKIKAIRAQHTRVQLALEIQKPFMNLMKCGCLWSLCHWRSPQEIKWEDICILPLC